MQKLYYIQVFNFNGYSNFYYHLQNKNITTSKYIKKTAQKRIMPQQIALY